MPLRLVIIKIKRGKGKDSSRGKVATLSSNSFLDKSIF